MLELTSRKTLTVLLKQKQLFTMDDAAKIIGYHVRYLRQLCRERKVDFQKILGRYYMTPKNIADVLAPFSAREDVPAALRKARVPGAFRK